MKLLSDDSGAILRDLAAESDPEPASDADAREARAAYERATGEAAAMVARVEWERRDG